MNSALDFSAVVAAVGDAVVACDRAGLITLWNPAAERIFGFTQAEAMGASLDIIIPERMRDRHWEGYHKTMETGITRYGTEVLRVPAIDKQGRALSISFTVAMLYHPDNKVSDIVSVMRDETAEFNKARAMRKRLSELEALVRQHPELTASSEHSLEPEEAAATCPMATAAKGGQS